MLKRFWIHHSRSFQEQNSQIGAKERESSDHPQSQAFKGRSIVLTGFDPQALVAEGIQILRAVNETSTNEAKPFVVVGDPKLKEVRS